MIDGINDNEKLGELMNDAIDMSGNEFAMGYDDSSCTWHFHYGARGAGWMTNGWGRFDSEPCDLLEALEQFLAHLRHDS